jgi:hypothetical protein
LEKLAETAAVRPKYFASNAPDKLKTIPSGDIGSTKHLGAEDFIAPGAATLAAGTGGLFLPGVYPKLKNYYRKPNLTDIVTAGTSGDQLYKFLGRSAPAAASGATPKATVLGHVSSNIFPGNPEGVAPIAKSYLEALKQYQGAPAYADKTQIADLEAKIKDALTKAPDAFTPAERIRALQEQLAAAKTPTPTVLPEFPNSTELGRMAKTFLGEPATQGKPGLPPLVEDEVIRNLAIPGRRGVVDSVTWDAGKDVLTALEAHGAPTGAGTALSRVGGGVVRKQPPTHQEAISMMQSALGHNDTKKFLEMAARAETEGSLSGAARMWKSRPGRLGTAIATGALVGGPMVYNTIKGPEEKLPQTRLTAKPGHTKTEASSQPERNALLRPLEKQADLGTTAALTGVAALLGLSTYGAYKLMRKLKSAQQTQAPQYNTAVASPTSVLVDKIDQGQA